MAKQDDWVRLTVRMPPGLYERLQAIVASGPLSMNAEIVDRLERSLVADQYQSDLPEFNETLKSLASGLVAALQEGKRTDSTIRVEVKYLKAGDDDERVELVDPPARERTKPKPD